MQYEFETLLVNIITLIFMFVGGCFALWQWRKGLLYKRTEIVRALIEDVRQDDNVSTIMDIIDWNEDFYYNGKFIINREPPRKNLQDISNDDLFRMIDHTLSIFSYICYLKLVKTVQSKDMCFFEYEIRRLVDNPHISNYLYSLYHWAKGLGVPMSFSYLIDYCLKKKYLDADFKIYSENNSKYKCFLITNAHLLISDLE